MMCQCKFISWSNGTTVVHFILVQEIQEEYENSLSYLISLLT